MRPIITGNNLCCPFCRGEGRTETDMLGYYIVRCYVCGAKTRGTQTREEAERLWNRRHGKYEAHKTAR